MMLNIIYVLGYIRILRLLTYEGYLISSQTLMVCGELFVGLYVCCRLLVVLGVGRERSSLERRL